MMPVTVKHYDYELLCERVLYKQCTLIMTILDWALKRKDL